MNMVKLDKNILQFGIFKIKSQMSCVKHAIILSLDAPVCHTVKPEHYPTS